MEALKFILSIGIPAAICLIVGIAMIIFEIFAPGFGAPGIGGTILVIVGIAIAADNFSQAMVLALIVLCILTIAFVIAMRSVTHGALSRSPLVNRWNATDKEGYLSNEDMRYFCGRSGIATTPLHPAGIGDFDGLKLDVVTQGEFIPPETPITIISVEGRRIVVEKSKGEKTQSVNNNL